MGGPDSPSSKALSAAIRSEGIPGLATAVLDAAEHAAIGVVVTIVAAELRRIYVNQAAADILGYSVEDLIELPPLLNVAPEDLPRMEDMRRRKVAGESVPSSFEVRIVRPDGSQVPVHVATSPTEIEGRRATVAFFTDVSAHRRAEEAQIASEARFRALVEASPDAISIISDLRFAYVNPATVAVLGHDRAEDLVGLEVLSILHADDVAMAKQRIEAMLTRGDRFLVPTYQYRLRHKDGTWRFLEIRSIPFDHGGRPAMLLFGRDVTEHRALQERLISADRLTALGTLAAGIAHEINNPLAYALLNLERLRRDVPRMSARPGQVDEVQSAIDAIRDAAERVAMIVKGLRTYSRPGEDEREPVEPRAAAAAALRMTDHELHHRARLVTSLDATPCVFASSVRLEQVFVNLLLNAAQAIPEGAAPQDHEIRVTLAERGERVLFTVEDTGVGIPAEHIAQVFDPFFTTKPASIGTGLGLAISHSIVTSYGGSIDVRARDGAGTAFTVSLPISRAANRTAETRPSAPGAAPIERLRILVVDDERTMCTTLEGLLRDAYDVTWFTDGAAAVEAFLTPCTFDAVLCDLMMPGFSGIDLYDAVRARHPGAERRFVFMTGGAIGDRSQAFVESVENAVLQKPFALEAVRSALDSIAPSRPRAAERRSRAG